MEQENYTASKSQRMDDTIRSEENESGLRAPEASGLLARQQDVLPKRRNERLSEPAPRSHRPTRVLSVLNRKGGVGKTTTAFNIAGTLATRGKPVLLMDMDPMGSLCRSLQIRPGEKTLSDVLVGVGDSVLGELIRPTQLKNLYVVPGDPDLRTFEMRHSGSVGYRGALDRALKEVLRFKPFPFVVIDCPPSLGLISGSVLTASTEVIVPVDGSTYGMGALVDTFRVIKLVRENVNEKLKVCGVLLNNVDMGTFYDQTVRDVLSQQFGNLIFKSVIPTSPEADVCSQKGVPVLQGAPTSWMAKAYAQLVQELIEREPVFGN